MNLSKKLQVSIGCSSTILKNSLASGAPPPNPLPIHMSIFSEIIGAIFAKKSIKFFKIWKNRKPSIITIHK